MSDPGSRSLLLMVMCSGVALISGCPDGDQSDNGDKVYDTGEETETDTDTDTDTDTETDTDTAASEVIPCGDSIVVDYTTSVALDESFPRWYESDDVDELAYAHSLGDTGTTQDDVLNGSPFNIIWENDHADWIVSDTGSDVLELTIEACVEGTDTCYERPFISGEVQSSHGEDEDGATYPYFEYGCYSAMVKPAVGDGLITSFFLWNETAEPDWCEIDAMEIFGKCNDDDLCAYSAQFPYYAPGDGNEIGVDDILHEDNVEWDINLSEDWHQWSILWEPNQITWFFDGKPVDIPSGNPIEVSLELADCQMSFYANTWAQDGSWSSDAEDVPTDFVGPATAQFKDMIYYTLAGDAGAAERAAPPYALPNCEGGQGLFALLKAGGRDGMGTYYPIEVEGTGRLTSDAWIRDARVFSGRDVALATSAGTVLELSRDGNALDQGLVPGNAPFLAADPWKVPTYVELGWTCSDEPLVAHNPTGPSYSFTLSEIGCPVGWPQLFTLRVHEGKKGRRISLETYGNPSRAKSTSLAPTEGGNGGYAFNYSSSGVSVAGRVLGYEASNAVISVDEVSYHGVPFCAPGTYQLLESP